MNNDLISRSALLEELQKGTIITDDLYGMGIMAGNDHAMKKIKEAPAVEPVLEPWAQNLLEIVRDLVEQFAYKIINKGRAAHTAGGLSALEAGFDTLGWDDPHPAPECECQHPGCHEWATCGTPTKDGYKRLCSRHYEAELANREAEKNAKEMDRETEK
jgi:hypothetical protein